MRSEITEVELWISQADSYMLENYLITLTADVGLEHSFFERRMLQGDTPEEFCEWIAKKYDLDSVVSLRACWAI